MDFIECVKNRRSVRKFKPDTVEDSVIRSIIETASFSPSWKNSQTTRYIAVRDSALKERIANEGAAEFAPNQNIICNAPLIILVTTVAKRSGYERDGSFSTAKETHWESFDAGIATQTLCLAAHNEGLGTVVMGIFDAAKVAEIASIPEQQKLSVILAVGYPDEQPAMPRRKAVDELLDLR